MIVAEIKMAKMGALAGPNFSFSKLSLASGPKTMPAPCTATSLSLSTAR